MADVTETPGSDRRRCLRILLRIPVRVAGTTRQGRRVQNQAEAIVISQHGALLKVPSDLQPGSEVEVENTHTQQSGRFRVVWISDQPSAGVWDVGLEAIEAADHIWGVEFPRGGSQPH